MAWRGLRIWKAVGLQRIAPSTACPLVAPPTSFPSRFPPSPPQVPAQASMQHPRGTAVVLGQVDLEV
eukprot:5108952-Pyramimonas_sp.AAC.1